MSDQYAGTLPEHAESMRELARIMAGPRDDVSRHADLVTPTVKVTLQTKRENGKWRVRATVWNGYSVRAAERFCGRNLLSLLHANRYTYLCIEARGKLVMRNNITDFRDIAHSSQSHAKISMRKVWG